MTPPPRQHLPIWDYNCLDENDQVLLISVPLKPNMILLPTFHPNKAFEWLPVDFRIKPKQTFYHGLYRSFTTSESHPSVNLSVLLWAFLSSTFLLSHFLAVCMLFPCLRHAVHPSPPPICLWLTLPSGLIIFSKDHYPSDKVMHLHTFLCFPSPNSVFISITCLVSVFPARVQVLGSQRLSLSF